MRVEFRVLGSLEVVANGASPELGPPKQRALLAILVLHDNEPVATDRLIELIWGERPPRTAGHSIQIYVSELRKVLEPMAGGPVIVTRPPGYLLRADPESTDSRRFERLVASGARELEAGQPMRATATLREAMALWRGPPLADFAYEEFAQPEIRRLEALRLEALERLAFAMLDSGEEELALRTIESVLAEDPLRERARELQMVALYRAGRHAEALRVYQAFRNHLAEELGLDPSPALRRVQERILLHDPALHDSTGRAVVDPSVLRNPYKGLQPFGEEDADDFFGRGELIERLIAALREGQRLLALVGPSGSGKSSVVRAGLIPSLRRGAIPGSERWRIVAMLPGSRPVDELGAALQGAGAVPEGSVAGVDVGNSELLRAARNAGSRDERLVLVIDQFEETFSMARDDDRATFLSVLGGAVDDPGGPIVILTLRADFYDRPLLDPRFAPSFTAGVVNVLPMTASEIEAAIVEPARRVGVEVDAALRAQLIAETVDRPAALPLLQYTLTELFARRTAARLSLEEYQAVGGVRGALSRRAEEIYGRLDQERRHVAVQIFLRLVRLGEGAADARRRAPASELAALAVDPVALSVVLEEFARHRLLTFDRDPVHGGATVEVAHEALLWEWERLAEWIEEHRSDLPRRESLARAADEWEASGADPDYLLTGSRLAELEAWAGSTRLELAELERRFLTAGLERRREEQAREEERQERQRRLERRARTRLWALAAALLGLVAVATFGVLALIGRGPPDAVLLYEGPGDAAFNDMADAAFDRAARELDLDLEKQTASDLSLERDVRRLSEDGVGLIVVLFPGEFGNMESVARDHPDTRYVLFAEGGGPRDVPNAVYLNFADEEGSFLAGAAAALTSETGTIGFIGGVDFPLIWAFQAGYEAGARAVDPDIRIRSEYLTTLPDLSGFYSPTLAASAAERLYGSDADVIYHAAGGSGLGLFETARELSDQLDRHLWAIGVDVDQYRAVVEGQAPEQFQPSAWRPHILTSMLKRYDNALFTVLRDHASGTLRPGVRRFGLAAGGVDITYSGGFIDDLRPEVERLRQRIIDGEIDVPVVPEEKVGADF